MRLGFACNWEPEPRTTWSGTPWNLRAALEARVDVVDVGVRYPRAVRAALKAAHLRRADGRWVTTWKAGRLTTRLTEAALRRGVRSSPCDAVVEIGDMGTVETPFFVYQDMSYDVLLRHYDAMRGSVPHFPGFDIEALRRGRDRQRRIYDAATGILAMSRWLASSLVEDTGVPSSKVHVVHPGAAALPSTSAPGERARPGAQRTRLLFVGKDFHTKAGEVVVEAVRRLRADYDPRITLTVAGPTAWPMPGSPPEGVAFVGRVPVGRVRELFTESDLFVLPSRLEGFGIVFVEALAHGLPCVGRDACAMPEIIEPGRNGALVNDDDPERLAKAVAETLVDDEIYAYCERSREAVVSDFSWDRAARDALAAVCGQLPGPSLVDDAT